MTGAMVKNLMLSAIRFNRVNDFREPSVIQ